MKKLLSLLSVLTISGSAVPTIIAASSYKKQEKILYYNNDHKKKTFWIDWYKKPKGGILWFTLNFGSDFPFNYTKFRFLGNKEDFFTKVSWGDTSFVGKPINREINKFNDKLTNYKINDPDEAIKYINNDNTISIQEVNYTFMSANFTAHHFYFFTFYWENESLFLQAMSFYDVETWGSLSGGGIWLDIGTGLKIFN
ncbi:hypothetical protein [Spiroplasma endosymbiont of Seladonia tumulorum]|uniref:hypothetical protein n=1 Tax=Spiroplasma endosymbiont of Seladonia tumulorum TaxID=3066321 RepID=UPI0030D22102